MNHEKKGRICVTKSLEIEQRDESIGKNIGQRDESRGKNIKASTNYQIMEQHLRLPSSGVLSGHPTAQICRQEDPLLRKNIKITTRR